MKGFLEISDLQKPPEGLRQAADVLQHLSLAGSRAAEKRLEELRQFCHHVWPPEKMSDEWGILKSAHPAAPVAARWGATAAATDPGTVGSSGAGSSTQVAETPTTPGGALGHLPAWDNSWQGSDCMDMENFQVDLSLDMGDIYSCYNDPSLPLTGIDELDWAEVGKMFSMNEL